MNMAAMKKASIVVEPFYQGNRLFALDDHKINRDNCLYAFSALKSELAKRGYDLQTNDIHAPEKSELVIYNEMPRDRALLPGPMAKRKSHLLIFESELIRPDNWKESDHTLFNTVFTWNDTFVNSVDRRGVHYEKSGFAHLFPQKIADDSFASRKACTLIAGNKAVGHKYELYSKRREMIHWFEYYHPGEFDYYGVGWERPYLKGGFATKVLRKTGLLERLPKKPSPCYRGMIDEKLATLRRYRFSICFENARQIPGYITEKIFDSFFAGCVPLYWGAPNISELIPVECYIDYTHFKTHAQAYNFMHEMKESRWLEYQTAIAAFLKGPKAQIFSADHWARKVVDHVTKA